MYNMITWHNNDWHFLTFPTQQEVIEACGKLNDPEFAPCAAEFARIISEHIENSDYVPPVVLITKGQALLPSTGLSKWMGEFAYSNAGEHNGWKP